MTSLYTVAVISDIHGNAAALGAVLDDLNDQAHDALVIAGDLVLMGPRPREALAKLRALGASTILGNTDADLLADQPPARLRALIAWNKEQLDVDALQFLASLPHEHRITPPDGRSPGDDLLIVHATPTDIEAILSLEADPFGEVPLTPEGEALRLLGDGAANLIVFGHIHRFTNGTVKEQRLASVGSVGFPHDGDTCAAYGLATWDGSTWTMTPRRVAYDVGQVAQELVSRNVPLASQIAQRLHTARYVPFSST